MAGQTAEPCWLALFREPIYEVPLGNMQVPLGNMQVPLGNMQVPWGNMQG